MTRPERFLYRDRSQMLGIGYFDAMAVSLGLAARVTGGSKRKETT